MVHDEDAVPEAAAVMSEKLVKQLADAGLSSLQAVLEHLGILTFSCLGKLNAEELKETCDRLRAVGFGPGHTCALRMLCIAAEEDSDSLEKDMATSVTKLLSNKLQSALRASGLVQIQMVLAQCGVRSCNCLANLSAAELQEVRAALNAAGFKESSMQAFMDLQNDISRACQHKSTGTPEVVENAALTYSAEERPGKYRRLSAPSSWHEGAKADHLDQVMRVLRSFRGRELSDSLEEEFRVALTAAVPLEEQVFGEPETPTRRCERRPVTSVKGDGEQRLTRQRIEKTLSHSKAIQADIVKYRDKVSGKLVEARVPTAVLALLKLRASCSGKPVSEQKLARMAVDVMEEHAFDPVRAVASLSPSSLLCPTGALRVLGSGFIGIVFLEEETGEVVKVMLDDFAQKEYELCRVFSQAQLGPAPLSLNGPCSVPGGDLYCIRMEPISHTLHGLLCAKTSRGLRHGLSPPQEMNAQRIGSAVVAALQSMHDKGLVHGDLHLHNIGMKDSDTKPTVQLIDFGRSASKAALTGPCGEAFRAGHEYDVCRFIRELCQAFDELQRDFEDMVQDCQKELRELKRSKETESPETDWQLHHARQLAGLQAFLDEEPKGLENAELAFNAVLAAVWYYATVKLDMVADGSISVKNRRLRQACKRRESACYKVYFKSDLFWGDCS